MTCPTDRAIIALARRWSSSSERKRYRSQIVYFGILLMHLCAALTKERSEVKLWKKLGLLKTQSGNTDPK
jgi:hypothetical protein